MPRADVDLRYSFAPSAGAEGWPQDPWWEIFDDPMLESLLLAGLRRNAALAAAEARVTRARSNAEVEGVLFDPSAQGGATVAGASGGGDVTTSGSLSVSFPLDTSRREQRAQERALIELSDALAARDALLLELSGEIARRFVRLSANGERLRHARDDLRRRQALATAVEAQVAASDATQFEMLRARASTLDARARLRQLEGEQGALAQELSALLGGEPQLAARLAAERGPLWLRNNRVIAGVPADLVRARPDIRRIELQYDAARTRIGDSEADRLPRISLSGTITATGDGLGWRFGPSIVLPPLSARVRDAAVDREIAAAQAILFDWQDAVVVAISEVEAAHARLRATRAQFDDLRAAEGEYATALTLATDLFGSGEITLLDLLDLEQSRADSRRALVDARAAHLEAFVTLNVALGVQDGLTELMTAPL